MRRYGATREDFGKICVAQRDNALRFPHALMKKKLTLEEYLRRRAISDPIHLFDCVMPCAAPRRSWSAARRGAPARAAGGAPSRDQSSGTTPSPRMRSRNAALAMDSTSLRHGGRQRRQMSISSRP